MDAALPGVTVAAALQGATPPKVRPSQTHERFMSGGRAVPTGLQNGKGGPGGEVIGDDGDAAASAAKRSAELAGLQRIWQLYSEIVAPAERLCHFEHFDSPIVTAEEFEARPQVLLVGQYSTGKTSMVKWLTGCDSVHFDIKPQPSSDKFMAIVHGEEEQLIHGNAATCLPQLPYQGLSATFGATFLSNFNALAMPSDRLRDITFIDTPGVLSGCKQRIGRSYEFGPVCAWMASRADLVLLTFDAHKLDISDEFEEVMRVLRPHADKVRCVLNKADQIDKSNLVRVYGALLWNVGKVLQTPEVVRVYVSSFWDKEYQCLDHAELFDEDRGAVLKELKDLPRTALMRKINTMVQRVRQVKAYLCVLSHIRSQIPWFRTDVQLHRWVDKELEQLVDAARRLHSLSPGDMPNTNLFRERLACFEDLSRLPRWDKRMAERLDVLVTVEVPAIMSDVSGVSAVHAECREAPAEEATGWGGFFRTRSASARSAPY